MYVLNIILVVTCFSIVGGYSFYNPFSWKNEIIEEEIIHREEFGHVFGIEPFIHAHAHDPATFFRIFLDDEFDEYENITYPSKPGDSIVKIRKPSLTFSPRMSELLFDYMKSKNRRSLEAIEQIVERLSKED
ncbi:hypothetical protein ILUMI_00273 [Ignelater luminosus]|uniref:Uncharacterized protein n=1 Tax=Ignelater luminosus TaxID=2038154 RepID=A0A8K0DML5_IGNLU|nr:hypothetical protein ILUMI_00273 [Ignelater luminosus]